MPKESGPQKNSGMDRREFLKKTAGAVVGAVGALATERVTQAQEKNIDSKILGPVIKYPEVPKLMTPEVEAAIKSLSRFQASFAGSNSLNRELYYRESQTVNGYFTEEGILAAKKEAWVKLQNLIPEIKDLPFSDSNFFDALSLAVPRALAEYGILVQSILSTFSKKADQISPAFSSQVALISFLEVSKVEHDKVKQWGMDIDRNIVYLKGSIEIDGKAITDEASVPNARQAFGNIFLFDRGLDAEFAQRLIEIQPLEAQIATYPKKGGLVKDAMKDLESSNTYHDAIQVPMVKIFERMNARPTIDEYKGEVIAHETRHFVDNLQGIQTQILASLENSNEIDLRKKATNEYFHLEINSTVGQLKYAPNRNFAFYRLLFNTRDFTDRKDYSNTGKLHIWIVGHIVGLLAQNPEKYGIVIKTPDPSKINVSSFNQILSQLDVILDHPELVNALCDQLIDYHNKNLAEDIAGETFEQLQGPFVDPKPNDSTTLSKLKTPAKVLGGAALAGLGFEALRRRKNKIANTNVSRQQKRAEERKKE